MSCRRMEDFVSGLILGAAFGVLMGLLFAPYTGAQTRRRLAQEAQRAAETARGVADRAEEQAGLLGERVDHYLGRDEEVAWRRVREIREGVERYTQAQMP